MKARPILFSAPMIQALLAGRKTQTRRLVKPQPFIDGMGNFTVPDRKGANWNFGQHIDGRPCTRNFIERHCPYGVAGDVLWARESFRAWERPTDNVDGVVFSADLAFQPIENTASAAERWADVLHYDRNRRKAGSEVPSIHMPRWASRLTLEITDVRVERLQDISEADARAEGSEEPSLVPIVGAQWSERGVYATLWEHINGKGSWAANPWVWAVTFTAHQQNVDAFSAAERP